MTATKGTQSESVPKSEAPERIVLIDDEGGVVLALKLLLQMHGFIVETFTDPQLGLDFILQNLNKADNDKIDYILCDLRMPKKSGIDLLKELKLVSSTIPFFLMSGHAEDTEQQQALQLGAAGFLAKPFSPEDFLRLLGR
jgi:CheY-like chemotaxis protein